MVVFVPNREASPFPRLLMLVLDKEMMDCGGGGGATTITANRLLRPSNVPGQEKH